MDATPQNLTPRKICLSTLAEEEAVTIPPKQKDLKSENTSKKIEPIQLNGPTTTCLMESNSCKMKELPKPPLTPITISTSSDKCIFATKTSQEDSTTTRRQSLREMRLMNPLIGEPLGYDVDDNNYNEKTNTITFSEKFGENDYLMGDEEWLSKLSPEEIQGKFEVQSLAFKIDQDSLRQRFENHYRAREVAEQNIESELDIIKTELRSLTESNSVEVSAFPEIAKLNRSIEILEKSIDRLSSLSEVYGAVYQELRSSQAVMTAVKHVDNLKQEMEKNQRKFMTAKKVLLENNLWDEESAGATEPSIPSRLNSFQSRLKENRRRASLAALPKNIKLNQIFQTPNMWREESNTRPISRTNLGSKSSGNSKEHEQILDKSFKRGISLPSRCENTSPYKRLSRVHEQSKLEAFREQFKSFSRSLDSSDAGVGLVLLATTIFIVILVLLSIKYSLQ